MAIAIPISCHVLILKNNVQGTEEHNGSIESVSKSSNNKWPITMNSSTRFCDATLNFRRKWPPFNNKLQPQLIVQVLAFYIQRLFYQTNMRNHANYTRRYPGIACNISHGFWKDARLGHLRVTKIEPYLVTQNEYLHRI